MPEPREVVLREALERIRRDADYENATPWVREAIDAALASQDTDAIRATRDPVAPEGRWTIWRVLREDEDLGPGCYEIPVTAEGYGPHPAPPSGRLTDASRIESLKAERDEAEDAYLRLARAALSDEAKE